MSGGWCVRKQYQGAERSSQHDGGTQAAAAARPQQMVVKSLTRVWVMGGVGSWARKQGSIHFGAPSLAEVTQYIGWNVYYA
jgi:hypothetical protein